MLITPVGYAPTTDLTDFKFFAHVFVTSFCTLSLFVLYFVRKKGETIEGLTDGLEEELVSQVLGLLNKAGQLEEATYASVVSLEYRGV